MIREHAILIMSYIDGCVEEGYQPIPEQFVKEFVGKSSIIEEQLINVIIAEYPDLFLIFKETIDVVRRYAQAQRNKINQDYLTKRNNGYATSS